MRSVNLRTRAVLLPALLVLPVIAGCTTRTAQPRSGLNAAAAVAPALAVERFLQAVNAEDFPAMAGLFGTVDGPVEGDYQEVELRMATIAQILQHQDYQISDDSLQPGRANPTRRIGVDLTIGGRMIRDVAFLVVQTDEGHWMLEEIDLEKVTG